MKQPFTLSLPIKKFMDKLSLSGKFTVLMLVVVLGALPNVITNYNAYYNDSTALMINLVEDLLPLLLVFYVITGIVSSLKASLSRLNSKIISITTGDLNSNNETQGQSDEFKSLLDNLNQMQKKLHILVDDVGDVSSTLNISIHEIADSNSNLSERTQEQASCLVETSASLNNLTDTIKKNADSAKEAANFSIDATTVAQKGGEAVTQVIATMGDINHSAHKIQEITGVIDSIAFQTNLLALNASVEAARAGEQGRGFAVVASEVRNLAQRSAEAAKQIKALISDSMAKVASGDEQVKVTSETMQDIVNAIEKVNSLIGKIAIASNEQSVSIEQINIVISQLEENTQKNAAQVEEVAASAELLKDQSSKLVDVVTEFKVEAKTEIIQKTAMTKNKKYSPSKSQKALIKNDKVNEKRVVKNFDTLLHSSDNIKTAKSKNSVFDVPSVLEDENAWREF